MAKKLKATCQSPANIAFIKYWGKKNEKLRIPQNNSISMNLSNIYTITTVEFSEDYPKDSFELRNEPVSEKEKKRVFEHLDRIRKKAGIAYKARVVSINNFPKSTGLSSSSSGFSALTLAACLAAGLNLSKREMSKLTRQASGSACRSIADGFVEWQAGNNDKTSYAYSLFSSDYWKIYDVVVIVSKEKKQVSSTRGHALAKTSPFLKKRLEKMEKKIKDLKNHFKNRDFSAFGELSEKEALNMHAVMITSSPSLLYWTTGTLNLMKLIQQWRKKGLEVYFTINTGQDIHILTLEKNLKRLTRKLKSLKFVKKIIVNKPTLGTREIKKHLF